MNAPCKIMLRISIRSADCAGTNAGAISVPAIDVHDSAAVAASALDDSGSSAELSPIRSYDFHPTLRTLLLPSYAAAQGP